VSATDGTGGGLPKASLPESLRFLVAGVVPTLVRGLFSPRRGAMRLLTALDADARTVRVLSALRGRHGGEGVRLLGGRMVTLWGEGALREVLDHSAERYASDSGAKGKGMAHFQPDALTVSRGEAWRDRRDFTEAVLATGDRVHPDGERFVAVVADEVGRMRLDETLDWPAFERLFDHLTLRIVFGDEARDDAALTGRLETLMGQANRLVGLKRGDDFYELYGAIERYLRDPAPGTLVARIPLAPQSDLTRVAHQVPHWLFAMRDTLGANVYRALAAIAAGPAIARRAHAEVAGVDLADPEAVAGLSYLSGCLSEAMRLWPTTPLLAREVTEDTRLAGTDLEAGTQVMIVNVFNHRDAERVADADRFRPERWATGERDPRYNHLSNGSQDCPGGPLVHLLGTAVLAHVLDAYEVRLVEPELDPEAEVPHMLDFFAARFGVRARERARAAPRVQRTPGG
jgi:cytochrome P450